ncbi:MAG: B12-binding domain-containing radical SAM protein [Nitrospirae bacterium]|nr:B12-binding domain-containing radical SAM protein [Nitrospirota bacterium]
MKRELVVLINPGHDEDVDPEIARSMGARQRTVSREDPPVSILNLGAYIRDKGYDVRILDTHVEPDYKRILKDLIKEKPLAIGLSVILGKFTKNAIAITMMINETAPEIPVVWGGKLVHLAAELILEELPVDYVIIGEGELSFFTLLDALRKGQKPKDIPGFGYKEAGKQVINRNFVYAEDLDSIYTSEDFGWDLIKDRVNYRQVPYFINLYTSRGCKYNCSFCYLKDIKQVKAVLRYRRRSPENVIKEIEYLNRNFGINVFTFGDDDFLYDLKKVAPVLEHIKQKGYYIEHIWTNINNLKPETIELLKGICQTVCYSIETVSPRLQKILRKVIPAERVIETNRLLRKSGINTVHNFMFGVPTERDEETKLNIDLMKRLKEINPFVRANCYILSPIPGTPIFSYAEKLADKPIQWSLDDLAKFHFRYMKESAAKFRPYLTLEDNIFYERATVLANELFTELNVPAVAKQIAEIEGSRRLKFIFGDISGIPYPIINDKVMDRKYILDKVLRAKDEGRQMPMIEPF